MGKLAIIGGGKMAQILLDELTSVMPPDRRQPDQLIVVNRTCDWAKELAETLCVDDIVAKACIVRDGEGPHVRLALVHRASFFALEPRDGRCDRVHPFVIRNCSLESEVVE